MDIDRVVADIERLILRPDQPVRDRQDHAGGTSFTAGLHAFVDVSEAGWTIGREPWVEAAVRVLVSTSISHNNVFTHGLVYARDTTSVLYLNERATMRGLGGRAGSDLDPMAYMQLLGELYSGRLADEPQVVASSASERHPPGEVVTDVRVFAERYPWVDAASVAPPSISFNGGLVALNFFSSHYYVAEILGGVDVLRWRVTCGGGVPADWEREYVVKGAEGL